ncbi:MAG: hypothetical protein A6D92_15670 [Symbiobacterium thermophilum]|uniref:Uncharacterized protein n=1 Tax=Symbiobacterium thermophilum TaxID=2734 RepID=A0A1Y2T5V4_SYMTR|nr:MAG: hypothetical protein A6D92_15670 [Symbiobacterium thermophilum]
MCAECLVDLNGQPYCKRCLAARMQQPVREINGLVRFVLSIAPGVGHFYMGYFHRGTQLFLITLVGAAVLNLAFPGLLGLYIPAAIFFSIFDAREIHLRLSQGLEVEDRGFFDVQALPQRFGQRQAGIALIVVGALALWRVLTTDLLRWIFGANYFLVQRTLNGFTFGALALALGVWLLMRQPRDR